MILKRHIILDSECVTIGFVKPLFVRMWPLFQAEILVQYSFIRITRLVSEIATAANFKEIFFPFPTLITKTRKNNQKKWTKQ